MERIYLVIDECGYPISYGATAEEAMEIVKSILKGLYETGQLDYRQYFEMLGELEFNYRGKQAEIVTKCALYGIEVIERGAT